MADTTGCDGVKSGTTLYNTCVSQSIQYCANDENITSARCRKDALAYPEINILRMIWCNESTNAKHALYPITCSGQTSVATTPIVGADASISNTSNVTGSSSTTANNTADTKVSSPGITTTTTNNSNQSSPNAPSSTTKTTSSTTTIIPNEGDSVTTVTSESSSSSTVAIIIIILLVVAGIVAAGVIFMIKRRAAVRSIGGVGTSELEDLGGESI